MDVKCFRTVIHVVLTLLVTTHLCSTLKTQSPPSSASNTSSVNAGYDLPVNLTVVVIEPADNSQYSLKRVLPFMDIAIEVINRLYQGIMNFSLTYGSGSCDKALVGVAAARISCSHNISVFIGPGKRLNLFSFSVFRLNSSPGSSWCSDWGTAFQ